MGREIEKAVPVAAAAQRVTGCPHRSSVRALYCGYIDHHWRVTAWSRPLSQSM